MSPGSGASLGAVRRNIMSIFAGIYRSAEALRHPKSRATQIPSETLPWNPTLTQKTRKNGAPVVRDTDRVYCLILGFTAE